MPDNFRRGSCISHQECLTRLFGAFFLVRILSEQAWFREGDRNKSFKIYRVSWGFQLNNGTLLSFFSTQVFVICFKILLKFKPDVLLKNDFQIYYYMIYLLFSESYVSLFVLYSFCEYNLQQIPRKDVLKVSYQIITCQQIYLFCGQGTIESKRFSQNF